MHIAHKNALDTTKEQEIYFLKASGVARKAFNWGLDAWIEIYRKRKAVIDHNESQLAIQAYLAEMGIYYIPTLCTVPPSPSVYMVNNALNAIKKEQFPWMKEVTKCAPQLAIHDLGKAFKNFFNGTAKYPKHKSRKSGKLSFRNDNVTLKVERKGKYSYIRIPNLGWVRMCEHLRFTGKVISATISYHAGRWYASITVDTTLPPYDRCDTQASVGVDLGVKTLAVLSNGETFEGPKPMKRLEAKLNWLQRRFARTKTKTTTTEDGREIRVDSRRRKMLRLKIQRIYARMANIRKDCLHKLTTYLVQNFDNIFIEDLNVSGMAKNHCLAKAILDMGFYEFKRQLVYKAKMYGARVFMVDRWYPSSKLCSCCGHKQHAIDLSVREWTCEWCGVHHDRDMNAAKNLDSLFEYVKLVDENNELAGSFPVTAWGKDASATFTVEGSKFSLKNLTAE